MDPRERSRPIQLSRVLTFVLDIRVVVLAASLWLLPACGLFSSRKSDPIPPAATAEVTVQVESHHWSDIVVYLMNGSQSQRLGLVAGLSSAEFGFPYRQLAAGGKVRLRAQPVGGQASFTSEDVVIQSGQGLKWTLESNLRRSSLAVY